jgi:penicillin-binding protein 2
MEQPRPATSMYHRRLRLIALLMGGVMLLLALQLGRLTLVEGSQRLGQAEQTLHRRTLLPTWRGSILDRQGRKIAVDRPGYAVAVEFDVITGAWEMQQARREARRELGASRWATLSPAARLAAARDRLPQWRAKTERLYAEIRRLGGIDEAELNRRLDAIRGEVQETAAAVWAAQRAAESAKYGEESDFEFRLGKIREQTEAHVVLPSVSDAVAFEFRALADQLPGMLEVQNARRRVYPWSEAEVRLDRSSLPRPMRSSRPMTIRVKGVADHICGSMRPAVREDVQRRPYRDSTNGRIDLGGYRAVGDTAGERGLEKVFEDHLRGTRGQVSRRLDSDAVIRVDPVPGKDLQITLDTALQARIQAILSHGFGLTTVQEFHHNSGLPVGWKLNSAAVVMEVETGEILAMVSMPTRAEGEEVDDRTQAIEQPWVNRPVEAIYPPGSIIKPLVLVAAVTEGVHDLNATIECTGHYFPNVKDVARCWIYRERWGYTTHGPLKAEDALGQSCNIFFYTLADRLGMNRLSAWYGRFGMGSPLHVGLEYEYLGRDAERKKKTFRTGEAGGHVPDAAEMTESALAGQLQFDTIILGIGQGPIAWTPLHAANAYATIARGGAIRDAKLVLDDSVAPRTKRCDDLHLHGGAVDAALEGLRRAVSEGGTGHHITYSPGDREPIFNAEGVTVWGKTGTAQAPRLILEDTNGNGRLDADDDGIDGLDHAWFVGLVGPDDTQRPMFAISVIVEYGGSGGRVAGPIANQIIHALQREGYLPERALVDPGAEGER